LIAVNDNTQHRIEALFPPSEWQRVSDYLSSACGANLPLIEDSYDELVERIRFAVLKLSGGNFERLVTATEDAAIDWRDTLVAAGFADDTRAHLAWLPTVQGRGGD